MLKLESWILSSLCYHEHYSYLFCFIIFFGCYCVALTGMELTM